MFVPSKYLLPSFIRILFKPSQPWMMRMMMASIVGDENDDYDQDED